MDKIMEYMEERHNFKRSKPQYERMFKIWGFRKNKSSARWGGAARALKSRDPAKPTKVYIQGDLIDLHKATSHGMPHPHCLYKKLEVKVKIVGNSRGRVRVDGTLALDSEIHVYTPPSSSIGVMPSFENLPWIHFHRLVESNVNPHLDLRATSIAVTQRGDSSERLGSARIKYPDSSNAIFSHLSSLLPSSHMTKLDQQMQIKKFHNYLDAIIPDNSKTSFTWAHAGTGLIKLDFSAPHFSLLVYLASNGFLNLEGFKHLLEYVEHFVDGQNLRNIFSRKEPTIQAFLERVFRAALELRKMKIIEIALLAGANPNIILNSGRTALGHAISERDKELTQLLISVGADVNMKNDHFWSDAHGRFRLTKMFPLELAACTGNSEIFQALLDSNANLGSDQLPRLLALYRATLCGHSSIVKYLLDAGVKDYLPDPYYDSFEEAITQGNMELVKLFADINSSYSLCGRGLLAAAAKQGSMEIIKLLLNRGALINEFYNGRTPLHVAALEGNLELVKFLVKAGADTHAQVEKEIGSALQTAANSGHLAIFDFLLNARNHTGFSQVGGAITVLEALINYDTFNIEKSFRAVVRGEIINFDDFRKAISSWIDNDTKIVQMLLQATANVKKIPARCLATVAAKLRSTNIDMIALLLEAGILANTEEKEREDIVAEALCAAIKNHDGAVIQKLLELLPEQVNCKRKLLSAVTTSWMESTQASIRILMDAHFLLETEADLRTILAKRDCCGFPYFDRALKDWGSVELSMLNLLSVLRIQDIPYYRRPIEALQAAEIRWCNDRFDIFQTIMNVRIRRDNFNATEEEQLAWIYGALLQQACSQANVAMVRALLNVGVKPNSEVMRAAIIAGHIEIIKLLLDAGTDVHGQLEFIRAGNPLHKAVSHRYYSVELTRMFLDAGADVNAQLRGGYGTTALHQAVLHDDCSVELTRMLLDAGANVNAHAQSTDKYGRIPLHQAVLHYNHSIEIIQMVLHAGADVITRAGLHEPYKTALQAAVMRGDYNAELVQLLLDAGADVNAPAHEYGATALQAAAIHGYVGLVVKFLELGADLNALGRRTALEGAAEHGRIDMVQLLMDAGADEASGVKAMKRAREEGHMAVHNLIKNYFGLEDDG